MSLPSLSGTVNSGTTGEAGVTVTLLNSSGSVVATTKTGSTGAFSFTDLAVGTYQVKYTAPGGMVLQTGSEAAASTGLAPAITLALSETATLPVEQVLSNPAVIQSNVLHFGAPSDPSYGGGDGGVTVSLLNAAGQVIATTVSQSNGWFDFTQLAAGTYEVEYTAPTGQVTKPGTSSVTAPITLGAGQSVWATSGSLVSGFSMTGSGQTVTEAAGSYVITGTASHSTLTLGAGNQSVTLTGTGNTIVTGNGNQTITLSGTANSITVGTGTSVISAGTGNDTVHAAGGSVTISATGGGNLFDAGAGMSFLQADGSAGNIFMLNPAATGTMTTITGFDVAAADILDLKRTLAGTGVTSTLSNVTSYITSTTSGGNTTLYVDPTGGHGTAKAFAVLSGVQTSIAALQSSHNLSLS